MLKLIAGIVLMGLAAFLGRWAWVGGDSGLTVMANLVLFFGGLELWIRSQKDERSRS